MSKIQGLEHEVAVPKKDDYHGHPNYIKVYIVLLLLFGISLLASKNIENATLLLLVIFGISTIKAALVIGKFMHLQWEAWLIWIAVGVVLFILIAFFFGVIPDIIWVPLDVVTK